MTREEAIKILKAIRVYECYPKSASEETKEAIDMAIEALADRPTTDCTKFMEWLKAEVLDEENWKLNAVANGEVICRKFRKLGWLDVEDGYYVDTRPTGEWISEELENMICNEICYYKEVTVDADSLNDLCEGCLIKKMKYTRPTGEWVDDCTCSICHWMHEDNNGFALITKYNYCPNCGARMEGGEEE